MPKSLSKFYNFCTKLWYKFLRHKIRMHVEARRKVKNPRLTVIFLHGISATSNTWTTTIRQFSRNPELKNVELISLDLLGFGKSLQSNWLDYDYDDYDKALDYTLKHLKVHGPVVLVGHSMGALIAAHYANSSISSINLAQLILVSPPILLPEELAKLPDKVYTKSYSALHQLAQDEPAINVIANFIQRFSSFDGKYLRTPAFARSMDQIILNQNNYQTFKKLKTPTLIIHGHFDPLVMYLNLKKVTDENSTYIKLASVMGHHDISTQKRMKILIALKQVLWNEENRS